MSSSTFRILFLLRKAKTRASGLATISIRITIDGNHVEFSSKLTGDPKLWDAKSGRMTGKSKAALETNQSINHMLSRLNAKYREILDINGYITAEKLRDSFLGLDEQKNTLLTLFTKKINQKKALVGNGIQESALGKYECAYKKLEGFISSYFQKEDILIKEVQYDFITNFDIYLRSECKCGHNTVVRYMRYLKQVTTDAFKCRIIQIDPFTDFTLTSKRGNRKYLTEDELKRIINRKFESKDLEEVRDVFIFCCMTGLAYIDVYRLKATDISSNDKGELFIIKDRVKTGVQSYIPLLEIPRMIIEKYSKHKQADKKLLPLKACQNMNIFIKEIAVLCGINKNLSTHCGRHTYATLMLTKGVTVESVSKMLGHTDIKTTQIYAKILNEKVDSEMDVVKHDLNNLMHGYNCQQSV